MELPTRFIYYGIALFAVLVLISLVDGNPQTATQSPEVSAEEQVEQPVQANVQMEAAPQPVEYTTIKPFTSLEFKQAYDALSHPNMKPIIVRPPITGQTAVDAHIQALAESRGYQLRQVASGVLNQIGGIEVQELLIHDWQDLTAAAQQDGISIALVSGYRSIEEQTTLFNQRLAKLGLTDAEITSGAADPSLDSLLSVTAPPGYSRHHSGYTIDLENPGVGVFDGSPAEQWLSADNYRNAKRFGFIPSYPDKLDNQGPNPEPWEYVWVSKAVTYEQ